MSDSLITIVAIFLAAILMFVFPLMSVAERSDDMSQLVVQTAITEFVDNSRTVGKISFTDYNNLITTLNATGNSYNVEMEVKILDGNVGKKSAWLSGTVIGENVYCSVYTTQILDVMLADEVNGVYQMKEGDILSASAENTNVTFAQSIKSVVLLISGRGTSQIAGHHSGVVTANSK